MTARQIFWAAVVAASLSLGVASTGASQPHASGLELLDSIITRYCLACHNHRIRTAGLTLANLRDVDVADEAEILEKVLHKLRVGEMPPAGRPRPDAAAVTQLVNWLETELDAAAVRRPNPGSPVIHRLNRAEYRNAIRDLLGLDLDHARDLPADDSGYGFDNIGDVLTVSPVHIEKYISSARRIARLAVGTVAPRSVVERYESAPGAANEAIDGLPPNESGGILFRHYFPFDANYSILVRVRGRQDPGLPAPKLDVRVDGSRVRLFDADFDAQEANQGTRNFELQLELTAGNHDIGAGFLTEYGKREGGVPGRTNGVSVQYILVGGPFGAASSGATESRRQIFVCRPGGGQSEESCARQIVTSLARRAYRRPVTGAEIAPLFDLFRQGRADSGSFDGGIELALSGVLVSPNFLFRMADLPDSGVPGEVYRLSDIELASRLSFFLWSSIPDDELLGLAERGLLSQRTVLVAQLRRMLADPRIWALVDNFGGQWLHLRNVADWTPDPERFPRFDDSLRYAFQRETELFLEHLIREDRSVLDLVASDYTFLNERLSHFYGIEGVTGGYFRRVPLTGSQRGGVVTHGSVLMVTSYPTRTSPVLRGKWILENLLGTPPPPPPPNVPALPDIAAKSAGSLREELEQHRSNPSCASCHGRLDPLGFALENFDAVGRYRSEDGGEAIESSGTLPDGTEVDGFFGLRDVLLARRREFVEALSEKLLTYALGRGVEYYDRPAVRNIRRRVEAGDFRFSALVEAIVESVPFRSRRTPD